MREIPSVEEQQIVYEYCNIRPLTRPRLTYCKMALKWGLIALSIIAVSLFFADIFADIFADLSADANSFADIFASATILAWLSNPIYTIIILSAIISRFFCIDCIKLYQHYAPESIRRKCMLKPTCSEYAIIVFKRQGTIIGGIRTLHRLLHKCKGNYHYIDEP